MSSHWGYCQSNGPETWAQSFPVAGGDKQSPVDIKQIDLKNLNCKRKLEWNYTPENISEITNTGHGWQVRVENGASSLSGGPLQETYELLQFHCHWGKTDDEGSEHTINGLQFAGEVGNYSTLCMQNKVVIQRVKLVHSSEFEGCVKTSVEEHFVLNGKLHLVHWNSSKYSSVAEAFEHPDGFCVLGLLLKPGKKNEELEKVVNELAKIEFKNQVCSISSPFNPAKLLPNDGGCGYYTYQGSLTTPPCSECVIWIVFKEPIEVSPEQLRSFRNLKFYCAEESCPCNDCEGSVKNNFRPTLPLGQREILEGL